MSGETGRCRAAADFLQSLLGTVGSQPVTLRFPGIARFLRDEGGQSILRQLESRFQCVIELDGVHWSPPDPQVRPAPTLTGEGRGAGTGATGRRVPSCRCLPCTCSAGDGILSLCPRSWSWRSCSPRAAAGTPCPRRCAPGTGTCLMMPAMLMVPMMPM